MNELQLSLLGLGLVAILLVVVYNRWLERKHHQRHGTPEQTPSEPELDAEDTRKTIGNERQEPQWDHDEPIMQHDDPTQAKTEPVLGDASPLGSSADMPEPLPAISNAESWVDALATLRFYEPRTAGSIRETVDQMGASRFERIECYTGDAWHLTEKLPANALVSNVRCRLQLATRRGPVAADVLHEWLRAVENLAHILSAGLSVESEANLLERATNLDAFCARVDALISLNLKARDAAAMASALDARLLALGLTGSDAAFARLNAAGDVEFQVLADHEQGVVSLTLDFPHVVRPDLVVADMLEQARVLSHALDAEILDDHGRVLGEEGMALLSNQVVRLGAMLQAQGIEPGSALSRRLFS